MSTILTSDTGLDLTSETTGLALTVESLTLNPFPGTDIVGMAAVLLNDIGHVRWSNTEMLIWMNAGIREIVLHKPASTVTTTIMQCVGGHLQTVPHDGYMLFEVIRNFGTSGVVPGKSITPVKRKVMDMICPQWSLSNANAQATNFMFDPRNPKCFYLYPAQPDTGQGFIEILYGKLPSSISDLTESIPLDTIYANILVDYIMYRALGKDSEHAVNMNRSAAYYQAFLQALGVTVQNEAAAGPYMPAKAQKG
jgi:hypothetical protein